MMFPAVLTRVHVYLPLSSLVADLINSCPALKVIRLLFISASSRGLPSFRQSHKVGNIRGGLERHCKVITSWALTVLLAGVRSNSGGLDATAEKGKIKHSPKLNKSKTLLDNTNLGSVSCNFFCELSRYRQTTHGKSVHAMMPRSLR